MPPHTALLPQPFNMSYCYFRDLGLTRCVRFDNAAVSGARLREAVAAASGLPEHEIRLLAAGRALHDDSLLEADENGLLPNCTVLLRLCGGKVSFLI